MQVIWSRTAQTRSCRCHSCLHAATTVARRATTAASKRRLKASDVFTACYSAMFATAALVDMKLKRDRRKQWDLAIAEAKSSSNVFKARDASSAAEDVTHKIDVGHSDPQNLVQCLALSILGTHKWTSTSNSAIIGRNNPNLTPLSIRQDNTWEEKLSTLDSHLRGSYTSKELEGFEEGSISSEENTTISERIPRYGEEFLPREPKSSVHLEQIQLMVLNLVTRFLVIQKPNSTGLVEAIRPLRDVELETKIMADQVALLEAGHIWHPKYYLLSKEIAAEREYMNKSIKTILTEGEQKPENIESVVAKVCYNLLVSSAPPNIDTYNIMLIHFTRMQQHHLAQVVVDSFFEESKFVPTPRTIAAILNHYAAKKDVRGFHSIVQRMRGTVGDMRIKSRHWVSSCPNDHMVHVWAQNRNVIQRNAFLIAKVPRDAVIFTSLILGSLHLFGSGRAVLYFRAALREGFHVSVKTFERIAQVCLSERNKKAATALLSAIVFSWHDCKGSWKFECHAGARGLILQLMGLCGIEPSFNPNLALPGHLRKVDYQIFKAWSRALQFLVLDDDITQMSQCISNLEILIATAFSKAVPTEQSIVRMFQLIDSNVAKTVRREPGPLVTTMQLISDGFISIFKDMEAQLFDNIYAGLSPDSQEQCKAICKLHPNMDAISKLAMIRNVHEPRLEEGRWNDLIRDHVQYGPDINNSCQANLLEWGCQPAVAAF